MSFDLNKLRLIMPAEGQMVQVYKIEPWKFRIDVNNLSMILIDQTGDLHHEYILFRG
jgi:hypothetical protein